MKWTLWKKQPKIHLKRAFHYHEENNDACLDSPTSEIIIKGSLHAYMIHGVQ